MRISPVFFHQVRPSCKHPSNNKNNTKNPKYFDSQCLSSFLGNYNSCHLRNKSILQKIIQSDLLSDEGIIIDVKDDFIDSFSSKLTQSNKPLLVSISGESACGKSTLVDCIKDYSRQNDIPITFVATDSYFKDISDHIKKAGSFDNLLKSGFDLDAPDNLYMDELVSDLSLLKASKSVSGRKYIPNGSGISQKNAIFYNPNKIIILEGTFANHDKLKPLSDVSIYVETDEKVRFNRYLDRAKNRNQNINDAIFQFDYVKDTGAKYIVPEKEKCDIVISGEFSKDKIVSTLDKLSLLKLKL